jgi:hypothetical protein
LVVPIGVVTIGKKEYEVSGSLYLNHQYGLVPAVLETISWHWFYGQWIPASSTCMPPHQCYTRGSFQCVVPLHHSSPTPDAFCNVLLSVPSASSSDSNATVTNAFLSEPQFKLSGRQPWTSPISGRVYNTIHTIEVISFSNYPSIVHAILALYDDTDTILL